MLNVRRFRRLTNRKEQKRIHNRKVRMNKKSNDRKMIAIFFSYLARWQHKRHLTIVYKKKNDFSIEMQEKS